MKNKVIIIETKTGFKTVYIVLSKKDKNMSSSENYKVQHKLRVKTALFGLHFHPYNSEMNFDYAIRNGCKILEDNRNI